MIWYTFGFVVLLILGTIIHHQISGRGFEAPFSLPKWALIILPLVTAIGYEQIMLNEEEDEGYARMAVIPSKELHRSNLEEFMKSKGIKREPEIETVDKKDVQHDDDEKKDELPKTKIEQLYESLLKERLKRHSEFQELSRKLNEELREIIDNNPSSEDEEDDEKVIRLQGVKEYKDVIEKLNVVNVKLKFYNPIDNTEFTRDAINTGLKQHIKDQFTEIIEFLQPLASRPKLNISIKNKIKNNKSDLISIDMLISLVNDLESTLKNTDEDTMKKLNKNLTLCKKECEKLGEWISEYYLENEVFTCVYANLTSDDVQKVLECLDRIQCDSFQKYLYNNTYTKLKKDRDDYIAKIKSYLGET